MPNYCKCDGCRWPKCHLTEYHQCGNCHQFGHGKRECGKPQSIVNLAPTANDPTQMPQNEQCTVANCNHTYSHSSGSHNDNFNQGGNVIAGTTTLAPALAPALVPALVPALAPQNTKCKLQDKQLVWLKERLHPDCYYHVDKSSFLTDTVHHIVKGLFHAKKEHPHESIYTFCSSGHGNVLYGILEKDHILAKVSMMKFDSHNEIRDFIKGYRMVGIDY